ncbi:heavy-metal-associated domain-containing protein [Haladaptatus salinisoli]|uniref:heavy-metal-associated domain-containing protein n=1 Tax=Haladaptatus salinisoli TaxID=2884876 RepID=UPI001D0BDB70|nr:heavy-metal-associated domain-containing protein [Haladaptatus salinisoli]
MERYEFHVDGMRCEGCERIIERELAGTSAASAVDADHERSVVVVSANDGAKGDLAAAIRTLGYDVDG